MNTEKVMEVLRRVEWFGRGLSTDLCPWCRYQRGVGLDYLKRGYGEGHADDCKLAALLADEVEKEEAMTKRYWVSEEQLEQISKALRTQALCLHDRLDACELLCLIRHRQRAVLGTSTLAATKKCVNVAWRFPGWTDQVGLVKLSAALDDLRDALATELAEDKEEGGD